MIIDYHIEQNYYQLDVEYELCRLYDPVHGCILINDKDIREYTQKSYRNTFKSIDIKQT